MVTNGAGDEERRAAQGGPAPLTQEQIHALARGIADDAEIARILEAQPPVEVTAPSRGRRKRPPVRLTADELSTLRERGQTPRTVTEKLRESEQKDSGKTVAGVEKEEPGERPPRSRQSG